MATNTLSPFVYWAQTGEVITLKVDLRDVKKPKVNLEDEKVYFSAFGEGAKGPNSYEFSLHLHSPIDPDGSTTRVTDRQVEFTLRKVKTGWWPRVTAQPQKPGWLKIDFERWKSEDDMDEEEPRDVRKDFPDIYSKLQKEELGYKRESMKKAYLATYNLCQFVGFSFILIVLTVRYYAKGPASMDGTYEQVGSALKFCQLLMFLEVMHPMFGYTKGGIMAPLFQVSGRAFILFAMLESEERMQTKPVVFYLFLVWSMVEVIRYPYYFTQVYNIENSFLTWLRYTIWVPLYPLGFLCEGVIIIRNIPYFEETEKFTVALPNSLNFAFHFPTFMRIYLLILSLPMMYFMMSYMYRARVKKLGPKSWNARYNK